jgi:methylenetetrahydrofolate--tRNA-(uracil-5-)-methyltransferase
MLKAARVVNFGLFPELEADPGGKGKERGRIRKKALADRALADLVPWLEATDVASVLA